MEFYIAEPNANLAVSAVWANHGDSAKRVVLGSLNELKDFAVSREKDIAFLKPLSFILNHVYTISEKTRKVKVFFQLFFQICLVTS